MSKADLRFLFRLDKEPSKGRMYNHSFYCVPSPKRDRSSFGRCNSLVCLRRTAAKCKCQIDCQHTQCARIMAKFWPVRACVQKPPQHRERIPVCLFIWHGSPSHFCYSNCSSSPKERASAEWNAPAWARFCLAGYKTCAIFSSEKLSGEPEGLCWEIQEKAWPIRRDKMKRPWPRGKRKLALEPYLKKTCRSG